MGLLKIAFFAIVAFLAAIGVFIGAVTIWSSLASGAISLSYTVDGKSVSETVTRATDSARYWKLVAQTGAAPVVIGAAALWYSLRKFRE